MKIVIFSSQFFNVVNYLLAFSELKHEFIWTPIVPMKKRGNFEKRIKLISGLGKNTLVHPIFLKTPNNSLGNLLNPRIFLHDFSRVFRMLKRLRPDVIIVSYVLDAFPIAILKSLLGCKLSIIATGGDVNLHQNLTHRLIRRFTYSKSDIVFAVSRDLKRKMHLESRRKIKLLPTGVDPFFFRQLEFRDALRRKWKYKPEDIIALTVSNLEVHKGVNVAIKTIDILRNRGMGKLKLAIVGDGSEKDRLQALIAENSLQKNVLLLGEKTRNEVLELYTIADFFLLTSYTEGLPFALLEAMACKKICIVSPVGDIPNVITTGYNGFVAESTTPADFVARIEEALAMSEEELNMLTSNARKTILDYFDLRIITKSLIDTLNLLVAHRSIS